MNALHYRGAACLLAMLMTIAACSGETDRSPAARESGDLRPALGEELVGSHVSGSVGDGPIVEATVTFHARTGAVLRTLTSGTTADYDLDIKTQGKNYPLEITARGGIDLVTGGPQDFQLVSGLLGPAKRATANLNPYTTLIYGAARRGGGINSASVAAATATVMQNYGFGLDAAFVPDPTSSLIDGSNVHHIVKSSETLGEMIRRTRDALVATGNVLDGDAIVGILASDLVDGYIDGSGALASQSRVAAVANVASAAVLVEAMANRLHVYGVDATQAMDMTIRQIRPTAPATATTANVGITAEALAQAERALRAAAIISADPRINEAAEVMRSTKPGSLPAALAARLPAGIDAVLSSAVTAAAYAGQTQLDALNAVARGAAVSEPPPAEPPPPEEPPPVTPPPPEEPPPAEPPPAEPPPAEPPPREAPLPTGSATVRWTPPTARVDGTALGTIASYKIYFGKSPTQLDQIVNLGGGLTSHMIENLGAGTWYFAVTATCAAGLESQKSAIVSKTIS